MVRQIVVVEYRRDQSGEERRLMQPNMTRTTQNLIFDQLQQWSNIFVVKKTSLLLSRLKWSNTFQCFRNLRASPCIKLQQSNVEMINNNGRIERSNQLWQLSNVRLVQYRGRARRRMYRARRGAKSKSLASRQGPGFGLVKSRSPTPGPMRHPPYHTPH